MFHSLDPAKIIGTLEVLASRAGERFPRTGLASVSRELTDLARRTSATVASIARPNYTLRLFVALVILAGIGIGAWLSWLATRLETSMELTNVMQGVDAATSLIIVFGGLSLYL